MKIAFIWNFDKASQVYDNWRDGLRAAIEILGKKHEVKWFLDKQVPEPSDKYDFYLIWDDSNTDAVDRLPKDSRKGLCLTTDPTNFQKLRQFDVIYCESEPIYDAVRREGIRAIKAFGTDTEFFKPYFEPPLDYTQAKKYRDFKKDIEYFYPATFSPWKSQSDIAHLGNRLYCVGTIQPDGIYEYNECISKGVRVDIGYFPVEKIRDLYARTQKMIIPAVHGSERTVLEAMSMNILPEVTNLKNVRTRSYIEEFKKSNCISPREFVVKYYSAEKYARDLERGICE